MEVIRKENPTHLAVVFDTKQPTERHIDYPEYKAQREEMPDGLRDSLPYIDRLLEAFDIPKIYKDGFEADDVIGTLAKKANNHFGIKCHKGWKGKSITHDDDEKGECFRSYKNPLKSYRDHSLFLVDRDRYSNLFTLNRKDYKGWASGLKAAGYATDPKYADKLISLIERFNLIRFDE